MRVIKELEEYIIPVGLPVREALDRLNRNPCLFQLIVDRDGKLIGTVTDGDIRRALISGNSLEDPVQECMHGGPITANTVTNAMKRIDEVPSSRRFVPVLDENGCPVQLVIDCVGIEPETNGTVLIMAGGYGKRMGEYTRDTPKPLLPVAGTPLLERLIKHLERSGFRRIYIATHYLHEKVQDFATCLDFDGDVELIEENTPLGTAGALGYLPDDIEAPLLVVNGDILTRTDFTSLLAFHEFSGNIATIGATRYEFEVPFGVLEYSDEGEVHDIVEKPVNSYFVSAGIYAASPELCALVRKGERVDMPDLLRKAIGQGHKVGMYPIHEYWIDVGRPADIRAAEESWDGA